MNEQRSGVMKKISKVVFSVFLLIMSVVIPLHAETGMDFSLKAALNFTRTWNNEIQNASLYSLLRFKFGLVGSAPFLEINLRDYRSRRSDTVVVKKAPTRINQAVNLTIDFSYPFRETLVRLSDVVNGNRRNNGIEGPFNYVRPRGVT